MQSNKPDDIFFDGDVYESQFTYAFPGLDVPFWIDLAKNFGPKVLELACGPGRVTIPVFESGVAVDGIDFSESMLRLARKHAEARSQKINFQQGDLRSLPFRDQYDLMYMPTATISHIGNLVLRFYFPAEMANLLHYNGFDVWRRYANYRQEEFNSESERYVILAKPRR